MNTPQELSPIALTRDLPESGLKLGDVGTIVHAYTQRAVYEVEFVSGQGETVALVQLSPDDIRPLNRREILHVRSLA